MQNLQTIKQSTQKGFTLIELMIVVAIIGILAALAIPAYSDYTLKAKVSEAATLSGSAKTAVDIYYSENGNVTDLSNTTLDLENAGSYTSKYISAVTVSGLGIITITMKPAGDSGLPASVAGGEVIYTPTTQGGNLSWAVTGNNLPTKYLPKI